MLSGIAFVVEYLDCPNEGLVEKLEKSKRIISMILSLMMDVLKYFHP